MYDYQLSDMPGPTDGARHLQLAQWNADSAYHDAWNNTAAELGHREYEVLRSAPAVVAARAVYDATVAALELELGPNAECHEVDTRLWSEFSDFYKSNAGFRPRSYGTRADVRRYFDAH